ncbi:hypothetical protein, partial [Escherichia coli]|uniref:hypothetical protein n=1 Tax=Escherichia coli TaxID=562 RepID=UPI0013AF1030
NIDATWQALSSMTQEQANTLVINADENILQGWLDLQRVWFDKSDFTRRCHNVHRIDTTAIIGELVIGWRGLQRWIVGRHAG